MTMTGEPSIALEGLQRRGGRGRRASWSPCIALVVAVAVGACSPLGTSIECEVREPDCSTIAQQAADWAAGSRPDIPVERIRVLANGGYEIHYRDGSIEAAVP